jgi:phosphoserine phosphatase
MTAVYVLRHPQTTWNAAERYQGRLESPLSSQGKAQSRLIARAFAGEGLDIVYSSPLRRAMYLARELAQAADAPLETDQRLTEMAQGVWEGLTRTQIEDRFGDIYAAWRDRPESVQFPHGENLNEVQARSMSCLNDICLHNASSNVAVVTHAVVVQVLAASALSLDLRNIHRIAVSNASVTTFCGDRPPYHLLGLNVTEPLYSSPVASAAAQNCVSWKRQRT